MLDHVNQAVQKPERAVVIGAGGFVGASIARRLGADGVPVLALTRQEVDLLGENAARQLARLLAPTDAAVVVSAIAPTRTVPMLVENVRMVEAVCDAFVATPPAHVVYVSSDAVYADDVNPVTEASWCQPSTLHGMMHAARELMLKTAVQGPLAILRPSLLYGAQDPHNGYGPNRFRRLTANNEPIVLFGDGEERRDHVFIDDVGTIASLVLGHRSRGVLNVATGVSASFREVAERVVALSPKPVEIKGSPRRNPIVHRHFDIAGCLKAFPTFHYTALADGVRRAAREVSR